MATLKPKSLLNKYGLPHETGHCTSRIPRVDGLYDISLGGRVEGKGRFLVYGTVGLDGGMQIQSGQIGHGLFLSHEVAGEEFSAVVPGPVVAVPVGMIGDSWKITAKPIDPETEED